MKKTPIGRIDHGIDGFDAYALVELFDEDKDLVAQAALTPADWVRAQCEELLCHDSSGAGTLFCHRVSVLAGQREDEFIAIAHVRRDC